MKIEIIKKNKILLEVTDSDIINGQFAIPDDITCIGEYAFFNCLNLRHIVIPPSVKVIKNSAFQDCTNLESVIFSPDIIIIGQHAFYNCTQLSFVHIDTNDEKTYEKIFALLPEKLRQINKDSKDNYESFVKRATLLLAESKYDTNFFKQHQIPQKKIHIIFVDLCKAYNIPLFMINQEFPGYGIDTKTISDSANKSNFGI